MKFFLPAPNVLSSDAHSGLTPLQVDGSRALTRTFGVVGLPLFPSLAVGKSQLNAFAAQPRLPAKNDFWS